MPFENNWFIFSQPVRTFWTVIFLRIHTSYFLTNFVNENECKTCALRRGMRQTMRRQTALGIFVDVVSRIHGFPLIVKGSRQFEIFKKSIFLFVLNSSLKF